MALSRRPLASVQRMLMPIHPIVHAAVSEPKGVVYTRRWVVEWMADLVSYTPQRDLTKLRVIEPSVGDGAFLRVLVERLLDSCEIHGHQIEDCGACLLGFELNESSADRSRALVVETLTSRGTQISKAEALSKTWVRFGDYLLESPDLEADIVIGNPPYIRLEDIPEAIASSYRYHYSTMRGRADIYIGFFEAALRQLKPEGVCAFICADRWMRNQYGAELRALITSAYAVDYIVEMHTADAFEADVDAYPAITVIRRGPQESAVVARAEASVANHAPALLTMALQDSNNREMPLGLRAATVERWFEGNSPWPVQSPDQLSLLRRLEETFDPLEKTAKVGIGVATGNDSIFITKTPDVVESSRMLRLAVASDLTSERTNWSGHYLINPWDNNGIVSLEDFPQLKAYFETHAVALKKRHTAVKQKTRWFKTIDRVTHALTNRTKLYIPDIKSRLEPVLDVDTYPHHNLYYIVSDVWDAEVLGGLLLSEIAQFFVESYCVRMRGGFLRFQAQYLRRIRIPAPETLSDIDTHALRKAFRERDAVHATSIALRLYGVSTEELQRARRH